MKSRKITAGFLVAFALCLLLFAGAYTYAAQTEKETRITAAEGIRIGTVDIGGMTLEEAEEVVGAYVDSLAEAQIVVTFHDVEREISMDELGFTWKNPDVVAQAVSLGHYGNVLERYKAQTRLEHESVTFAIQYSWDEEKLRNFIEEQAQTVGGELQDAQLIRDHTSGQFIITPSVSDITVDVDATLTAVMEAISVAQLGETVEVDAVVEAIDPAFTTAMAEEICDCLGEFTTEYDTSVTNRVQNLVTACAYIDGTLLMPGEQLSFFDYLYPCTAARGYKLALAYSNGREIQSYGGGICQVSTTCYNAVLLAELEVVSRYPHSMLVDYVEPGLDSNQSRSSGSNLCFANNTDYPVYVEAYCDNGTIHVALWGKETRPENRTVRYGSEYTVTWPYAGKVVYEYSTSQAYGTQTVIQEEYPKVTARAYKEVLIDGVVVSKEYLSDKEDVYRATPSYVSIGTGGLSVAAYKAGLKPGEELPAATEETVGEEQTAEESMAQETESAPAATETQTQESAEEAPPETQAEQSQESAQEEFSEASEKV